MRSITLVRLWNRKSSSARADAPRRRRMAEAMLDDALMREALGLRRRGAVNYTQELVHEDEPEPPKKRRAGGAAAASVEGSSRSGARKPAASSARKRRTRGANSDDDDDDEEEGDEDEDFSEDEPPQRKAKGRGSKAAPRQSRSEPRGKYKEPSDDDDDFHSDDGDERRGGAAAVAAVQSIFDKILSQRPAEKAGEEEGEVEPSDGTEYLAKPRGKCVCAAAAACRARLAMPSPACWSAPRDSSSVLHPAMPLLTRRCPHAAAHLPLPPPAAHDDSMPCTRVAWLSLSPFSLPVPRPLSSCDESAHHIMSHPP